MKRLKKILSFCLIIIVLLQSGISLSLKGAIPYGLAAVPSKLRVEALNGSTSGVPQPPIGSNEFDGYYADLKWDTLDDPIPAPGNMNKYINIYLQEVAKLYQPEKPVVKKEENLLANPGSPAEKRLRSLRSGTVYYAYAKSYYAYTENNSNFTSTESRQSNSVKFLTDIAINAHSYGTNQIKIEWDDVWNSGRRIDYKLYISENSTFKNTQPIYVGQDEIGADKPVKVNEAAGKLEYVHTVRDPGRVYYVKVVPDTSDTDLKMSAESQTVAASSYILAKTTKMSSNNAGTTWKLQWSPVVTGLGDNAKVTYYIYKGSAGSGTLDQYMAAVDDTTFFITLNKDENNYYIIKAVVTIDGKDVYPGIKIQSDKIYVKESEVPANPAAPEIVSEIKNAGTPVITYTGELKPRSATILWKAPRKATGEIDTDVVYDIWLVSDPNLIENPPDSSKIASSLKMGESNYVRANTAQSAILGYKYVLNGLTPNSTYYFKIVAKKEFVEFTDNKLLSTEYESLPAMKVIITPTDGAIDQPVVPGTPPLSVKQAAYPDSGEMVTSSSAVITLKNKWYEEFTTQPDGSVKWVYRTPSQLEAEQKGIVAKIEAGSLTPEEQLRFRKVEYDNGVTFDVGLTKYTEGMDYSQIDKLPTNKVIGFPSTANDLLENASDPDTHPDGKKHNVDIEINSLEPNTTYVIWVRAARRSADLISGPSDPILITTGPDLETPVEKPTVPVFNYYEASDNYVNLGWNIRQGYNYYIKYATTDNPDAAKDVIKIKPEDLLYSSYYKLGGLENDTLYYFWIQAEAVNSDGKTSKSEWSDSLPLKTLPGLPPASPKGFGVKNAADAITKNSITYEWLKEDGLEYILEVAGDINYTDSKEYKISDASEFQVTGLKSNCRYYARLYAYDPDKKLRSEPTQSVIVRTGRSNDEFDSDEDTENVITGDFIVKDPIAINHVWKVKITGVNADRLIYQMQNDNVMDYTIDLGSPPADTQKITLYISAKVFNALNKLKENIMIVNPVNTMIIRPGMLKGTGDFALTITLNVPSVNANSGNLAFKSSISKLEISELKGRNNVQVSSLGCTLKVVYAYSSSKWYKEGFTTGGTLVPGAARWQKAAAKSRFDADNLKGYMTFEVKQPGYMAAAEMSKDNFDDIANSWARNSINYVASKHKLNSIPGSSFQPAKQATVGDAVKFMLDMLDYSYSSGYMDTGVKAGFISSAEKGSAAALCTREKAIAMAVRVCELKTQEKAIAVDDTTGNFKDLSNVAPALLPKIRFAAESGIITYRFNDTLGPKDTVTRAEIMVLLEKLLKYAEE